MNSKKLTPIAGQGQFSFSDALTPKQRQCALLLAQGHTCRKAAEVVGVTPGTVSEWNKVVGFRSMVEELLDGAENESLQTLQGLKLRAVETLASLLESSPAVAIRAASAILKVESRLRSPHIPGVLDDVWREMMTTLELAMRGNDGSESR